MNREISFAWIERVTFEVYIEVVKFMSERVNLIFIGDRKLLTQEHQITFDEVSSCISNSPIVFSEVMRIEGEKSKTTSWANASKLCLDPIGSEDLLFAYFTIDS